MKKLLLIICLSIPIVGYCQKDSSLFGNIVTSTRWSMSCCGNLKVFMITASSDSLDVGRISIQGDTVEAVRELMVKYIEMKDRLYALESVTIHRFSLKAIGEFVYRTNAAKLKAYKVQLAEYEKLEKN